MAQWMLSNTKYWIAFRGDACVQKVDNTTTLFQMHYVMQMKKDTRTIDTFWHRHGLSVFSNKLPAIVFYFTL